MDAHVFTIRIRTDELVLSVVDFLGNGITGLHRQYGTVRITPSSCRAWMHIAGTPTDG
jgi:hypothetical protein